MNKGKTPTVEITLDGEKVEEYLIIAKAKGEMLIAANMESSDQALLFEYLSKYYHNNIKSCSDNPIIRGKLYLTILESLREAARELFVIGEEDIVHYLEEELKSHASGGKQQ